MTPKVSVIIPVYNVEKYLERCLDSLVRQTLQDIEIILVDDCSKDNSLAICEKWAAKDSRIKVISQEKNYGAGLARNSGMEMASGLYIAFMDSDDCVALNTYEYCYDLALKENLDVIRFRCDRFSANIDCSPINVTDGVHICSNPKELDMLAISMIGRFLDNDIHFPFRDMCVGSPCMALYKLSLLKKNRLFFLSERSVLSEDFVFNYNVLRLAERVGLLNTQFYHYFQNPQSLTTKVRLDRVEKAIEFAIYMTNRMFKDGYDENICYKHPMYYVITMLCTSERQIFNSNISFSEKRDWFNKQTDNEYLRNAYRQYPLEKIKKIQRIQYHLTMRGSFFLVYFFIKIIMAVKHFREIKFF